MPPAPNPRRTRFPRIERPYLQEKSWTTPFSSSPPEHAQKPIATVLVVDDTPDNLTLMGSLLREHFQVKVANHGEKALKIALSDTPPI